MRHTLNPLLRSLKERFKIRNIERFSEKAWVWIESIGGLTLSFQFIGFHLSITTVRCQYTFNSPLQPPPKVRYIIEIFFFSTRLNTHRQWTHLRTNAKSSFMLIYFNTQSQFVFFFIILNIMANLGPQMTGSKDCRLKIYNIKYFRG